jgi:hypothetical protein
VSILRRLATEVLAKPDLPEPEASSSLEAYAMALAWSGVGELEGARLLATAADRLETQRQAEWAKREEIRRGAEARERRAAGAEAMVSRWWAQLNWNESGAPDGSGPIFPINATPIHRERPRSHLDID